MTRIPIIEKELSGVHVLSSFIFVIHRGFFSKSWAKPQALLAVRVGFECSRL